MLSKQMNDESIEVMENKAGERSSSLRDYVRHILTQQDDSHRGLVTY